MERPPISIEALLAEAAARAVATFDTPIDAVAAAAGAVGIALVVASSFVKTMVPLRWLAVGSNLGFVVYGLLHRSPLIVVLHATLLPINLWRVMQMARLARQVTAAVADGDLSGVWLKPYMRRMRLKAGEVLFRRGDRAVHIYLLVEGRIEFTEIGEFIEPGRMFGEIAFFAPDRRRTLTALCRTDCTVLSIDEDTFRQIYFQDPTFGYGVVTLVAGRLIADRRRLLEREAAEADVASAGGAGDAAPPRRDAARDLR